MATRWRPDVESDTDVALAGVAAAQEAARQWEVSVLQRTIGWLAEVVAEGGTPTDFLSAMPIGGDGAPAVPEETVAEYAAALGMSPHATRSYLAGAWDLAHRLPRLHRSVEAGRIPVWRARLVTSSTHHLSAEAAAFIDAEVAPHAHKIGSTRLSNLVQEAEALFDPDTAAARAVAAAESRQVAFYPPARADWPRRPAGDPRRWRRR